MKVTKESIWLVVTIIIIVVIFLILILVLAGGASPGDLFNSIQLLFTSIALYMIAQLQAILR